MRLARLAILSLSLLTIMAGAAVAPALATVNSAMYLGQFLSPLTFSVVGALARDASARVSFWTSAIGFSIAGVVCAIQSASGRHRWMAVHE